MPLPILSVPLDDLLRYYEKTQRMYVEHLAEPVQLDCATAYSNKALPDVWNANHVRDAALSGGVSAEDAVRDVESHFAQAGTRCAYWSMNVSAKEEQTAPLVEWLLSRGYRREADVVMYLRQLPAISLAGVDGCRIIPARASYRHARQLAEENVREAWSGLDQLVEARLAHLDDPHWDGLLVLHDQQAVGTIGVLAVGEIGRIENLYVSSSHRRRGIARALMHRALEICARSLFKHVFISTTADNAAALDLYAKLGFITVGESVRYQAP